VSAGRSGVSPELSRCSCQRNIRSHAGPSARLSLTIKSRRLTPRIVPRASNHDQLRRPSSRAIERRVFPPTRVSLRLVAEASARPRLHRPRTRGAPHSDRTSRVFRTARRSRWAERGRDVHLIQRSLRWSPASARRITPAAAAVTNLPVSCVEGERRCRQRPQMLPAGDGMGSHGSTAGRLRSTPSIVGESAPEERPRSRMRPRLERETNLSRALSKSSPGRKGHVSNGPVHFFSLRRRIADNSWLLP